DLVAASRLEDDGELSLLLGLGRATALGSRSRRTGDRDRSRLDAPLVLEALGQLGDLHHREVAEIIDNLLLGDVHFPVLLYFRNPLTTECYPPSARSRAASTYKKFVGPAARRRTRSVGAAMKVMSSEA